MSSLFSQLVAVDVIFKHGLLHAVAGHHADGTEAVTLLVLLQLLLGYEGEALLAVTTHQRLTGTQRRDRSGLGFQSAGKKMVSDGWWEDLIEGGSGC